MDIYFALEIQPQLSINTASKPYVGLSALVPMAKTIYLIFLVMILVFFYQCWCATNLYFFGFIRITISKNSKILTSMTKRPFRISHSVENEYYPSITHLPKFTSFYRGLVCVCWLMWWKIEVLDLDFEYNELFWGLAHLIACEFSLLSSSL